VCPEASARTEPHLQVPCGRRRISLQSVGEVGCQLMTMFTSLVAMDQLNRMMGTVTETRNSSVCSESRVPSSHLFNCA